VVDDDDAAAAVAGGVVVRSDSSLLLDMPVLVRLTVSESAVSCFVPCPTIMIASPSFVFIVSTEFSASSSIGDGRSIVVSLECGILWCKMW